MKNSPLAPLEQTIESVQCLFDELTNKGVFVGGVASSLLGKPRFTADVDGLILIDEDEIGEVIELAKQFELRIRLPDAEEFARQSRVLLLQDTRSQIAVDLILGLLPFEYDLIENSSLQTVGGITVQLPNPEDLVVMKAVAGRPKDIEDIRGLLQTADDLDHDYMTERINGWAMMMELPELAEQFAAIVEEQS